MDPEKRRTLTVVYAIKALRQLDEIWDWNEQTYGPEHADKYIEFLERHIDALNSEFERGKHVGAMPELRYVLIRRKSRGHGHLAVYKIKEEMVHVLHVFHSAQDWENKLAAEPQ